MKKFTSVCALIMLFAEGCSIGTATRESQSGTTATTSAAIVTAPTVEELKRGNYIGIDGHLPSVTLVDGRWEGAPYVDGGVARPAVWFMRDFRLVGDLDRDGDEDAAVLLGSTTGGTGELIYLAVAVREDCTWRHAASALLGDRVQVREARIDGDRIVLGLVRAGNGDAMCCPGELVERAWTFSAARLEEVPIATPPGRLSIATLEGREWVLCAWTGNEHEWSGEPEVLVLFDGGRMSGSAGCNSFFASVTAGKQPGEVTISRLGRTLMSCPDPAASTEERFVRQIGGLKRFGFMATRLALSCECEGRMEVMLFDARPLGDK